MQTSERQAFQDTIKKLTSENDTFKSELTAIKIERTLLKNRVAELKELIQETAKTAVTL
ncbi:hypothetical protein [Lacihabitans soyangensis]|uniref:hypothetical protein n=1 Tax=Lacihabitans soyangensis TaxID=869394 RepID=UPI0020CF935F|nr:hypothetical protein [Lacihabitans soyangensis]